MDIYQFYQEAKNNIIKVGFGEEIEWCRNRKPFEQINPEDFFLEYVWVVLNSGFNNERTQKIYADFLKNLDPTVIKHDNKRHAIKRALAEYKTWFGILKGEATKDKIAFLETLPHIGAVTKYHLARNIGFDCVKPDVHLTRLAFRFGFETPTAMCEEIQRYEKEKLGTIDVILWRFCALNGSKQCPHEKK